MYLRKLSLLIFKAIDILFWLLTVCQVVACGFKSGTGRNLNADMTSEISWKLIVIKKKSQKTAPFSVEDLQTLQTVS